MEPLEVLERRIASAEDLLGIVKTMKVLAATSIRQYEQAVASLTEYNRTIEMGLHILLSERGGELTAEQPRAGNRTGALVFGTDQGMCGQFNEKVVDFALRQLEAQAVGPADRLILALGARTAVRLEEAGQPVQDSFAVPSSVAGVTPLVQEVLLAVEGWHRTHRIDQFLLFYHRPLSKITCAPIMVRLLPMNREKLRELAGQEWPSRVLPTFTMEWDSLFSVLVHQHLFVTLYRALAESLASENASRLAAMQMAQRNIEERLHELEARFHHERQSRITSELLDILSGFETVSGRAF